MDTKLCNACRRVLPLDQFPKDRHTLDGRRYSCKPCTRDYYKVYRTTEKGKACMARWNEKIKARSEQRRQRLEQLHSVEGYGNDRA
jgi:hypothetical protein